MKKLKQLNYQLQMLINHCIVLLSLRLSVFLLRLTYITPKYLTYSRLLNISLFTTISNSWDSVPVLLNHSHSCFCWVCLRLLNKVIDQNHLLLVFGTIPSENMFLLNFTFRHTVYVVSPDLVFIFFFCALYVQKCLKKCHLSDASKQKAKQHKLSETIDLLVQFSLFC